MDANEMIRQLARLAELIDVAVDEDDAIDRTYLLEAVQRDIREVTHGLGVRHVQDLIDSPAF